ncbi:unannotated protein [freshwater metagenome]|uniref:Unannotated protein n=1 Tax=freshwater metagenome TaxID=449393 RepID=A0A6J7SVL7_9ZZZZ
MVSTIAKSSIRDSIMSATRFKIAPRSAGDICDQIGKAAFAAATAKSTSRFPPREMSARKVPSIGE